MTRVGSQRHRKKKIHHGHCPEHVAKIKKETRFKYFRFTCVFRLRVVNEKFISLLTIPYTLSI